MRTPYIYHTTSLTETLEPHEYIQSYRHTHVKNIIHQYKFSKDKTSSAYIQSSTILRSITTDICIQAYIDDQKVYTTHIYTAPPSTMYARKEKDIDSMFDLIQTALRNIRQYISIVNTHHIYTCFVFNIYTRYLSRKKAQHLDGKRSVRIQDLHKRYYISLWHKLLLLYVIHIHKSLNISYTIIDDVSSTGATLIACKETLLSYLAYIHKKYPHVTCTVRICSLVH